MAIISRLRQLSGVRKKMLSIEELIPSLNSNFRLERHRNSYSTGFGQYYGNGNPISYGAVAAFSSSELNCYDLIYKNRNCNFDEFMTNQEDLVIGEIRFVPLKHIEGITHIYLFGFLKNEVAEQVKYAVTKYAVTYVSGDHYDKLTSKKIYSINIPNHNADSPQHDRRALQCMTDDLCGMNYAFQDEKDLAEFIYDYTENTLTQRKMIYEIIKKYRNDFLTGCNDINKRMSMLNDERASLQDNIKARAEKEFLIKSI